jgi:hypothetical protein
MAKLPLFEREIVAEAKTWTEDDIKALLERSDEAVERGIVRIFNLQTADEQASDTTKHHNKVGFSGVDASYGSYLAKWVKSSKHLTGKYLASARKMTIKYAGQLTKVANGELNGIPC